MAIAGQMEHNINININRKHEDRTIIMNNDG